MGRLIYADQLKDLESLRDEVDELREKLRNLEPHAEALEAWIDRAESLLRFLNRSARRSLVRVPGMIELQVDDQAVPIHRLLEDLKKIREKS